MIKSFIAVMLAVLSAMSVSALEVTSVAGKLRDAIGDDTGIRSLTVKGEINALDFEVLRSLKELQVVDLQDVTIAKYEGEPLGYSGRTVSAGNELPEYSLFGTAIKTLILPAGLTSIGEASLAATGLETLDIPAKVSFIGARAFASSSIKEITLPVSVSEIEEGAFRDAPELASVTVNSQTGIPDYCFFNCISLEQVTIAPEVTSIGAYSFAGTKNLAEIVFPVSLNSIGDYAFSGSGLKDVSLEESEKLTSVGKGVFENCRNLASIVLPESIKDIPEAMLLCDTSLTAVIYPEGVESLGKLSMAGLSSAEDVTLPKTLTYIGDGAMEGMTNLANVYAVDFEWKPELGDDVWKNVDQAVAVLHIPSELSSEFINDPQWGLFSIEQLSGVEDAVGDPEGFRPSVRQETGAIIIEANVPIAEISVFDIRGRLSAHAFPKETTARINMSDFLSDLYIVTVKSAKGESATFKLIKKQ